MLASRFGKLGEVGDAVGGLVGPRRGGKKKALALRDIAQKLQVAPLKNMCLGSSGLLIERSGCSRAIRPRISSRPRRSQSNRPRNGTSWLEIARRSW